MFDIGIYDKLFVRVVLTNEIDELDTFICTAPHSAQGVSVNILLYQFDYTINIDCVVIQSDIFSLCAART